MAVSVDEAVVVGDRVVVLIVVEFTASVDLLRFEGASTTTGFGPDSEPKGAPYCEEGALFVLADCLFFLVALYRMK